MVDEKLKARARLYYESHNASGKEVAERFEIGYRTLMVWVKKEGWEKGSITKGAAIESVRNGLLKKEFGSRLDMSKKQIQSKIEGNIKDLREFGALSVEEFNLEIEKLSDEILSAALSAEFIHKNMLESFIYAKHELKRISLLRKEDKPSPTLISMSEKLINMLATIQKSLYSKDILEQALSSNAQNIDLQKLSENELKGLIAEVIE